MPRCHKMIEKDNIRPQCSAEAVFKDEKFWKNAWPYLNGLRRVTYKHILDTLGKPKPLYTCLEHKPLWRSDYLTEWKEIMSEDKTKNIPSGTITTIKNDVVDAAVHGAKVAAATKASDALAAEIGKMLKKAGLRQASTPAGVRLIELLTPVLVDLIATRYSGLVPQADSVRNAACFAIEGKSRDLLEPLLTQLVPLLTQFAQNARSE